MCAECGCGITDEAGDESTGREGSEQQESA